MFTLYIAFAINQTTIRKLTKIKMTRIYHIEKSNGDISNTVSTKRMWKNIVVISVCMLLVYTSYSGMSSLQSSLLRAKGIGTLSKSIRYIAYASSSFFCSTGIVRLLGHKWALTVSIGSFLFFVLANGIGTMEVLLPAAAIQGFFSASLWTAKGAYFSEIAKVLAASRKQELVRVTSYIFGIFWCIFYLFAIISDIINSSILRLDSTTNFSMPAQEEIQQYCGINDCPWIDINSNSTFFKKPPSSLVWALVGVYSFLAVAAFVVSIIFVDDLNKLVELPVNGPLKAEIVSLLLATSRLFKSYKAWLLIGITFYSPVVTTFRGAEFNASWVTCSLGISMIGFIALPKDIILVTVSYLSGLFTKRYGNVVPMIISYVLGLGFTLGLFFWVINPDQLYMYYVLSIIYGVSVSITDVVVQGFYGTLFPDATVASFAMYNFAWCVIAAVLYGYSYYVCNNIKLYIVVGMLFISAVCYAVLQFQQERQSNGKETINIEKEETSKY